jgi:hydrogenase expression/formation protein HypD
VTAPSALAFRDPKRGLALRARLDAAVRSAGRRVTVMHVCGSHEQAIARFGLRATFPEALDVRMGPGCPVCVTDTADVDSAIAIAKSGVRVLTYGDMLRVPGSRQSLDDARGEGARVEIVYAATQAVEIARETHEPVVFFATGFETTAVATAAILLANPPPNLFVLSAHKWVPAAMSVVAGSEGTTIEGYLAAGHAATITGYGIFEPFVEKYRVPVVVAGFEPLDILAGLVLLVEHVARGDAAVVNAFPRCVSREGNTRALAALWEVFEPAGGEWRGIANVPGGELSLRERFRAHDARAVFAGTIGQGERGGAAAEACLCGPIMTGRATPGDCPRYGRDCTPESPVGACMVSTEGICRIWHESGLAKGPR